jgi:hypothetical protein
MAQPSQTYVYDSDGRKVPLPSFEEQRQSKVLAEGPDGKVIEETVYRRDAQGNALPPQKIRVVTRTGPGGEAVEERMLYEADLNGRMALQEKTTITSSQNGNATNTNTVVEKPSVNGGLQLFEKVTAVKQIENGRETVNRAIYRADATGRLAENSRESIERVTENGQPKETVSTFESVSTGRPILSQQRTTVALKNPDGSTTSVVTIYGVDAPGRPAGGPLKVREQQILTKRSGQDNTIVESLSIRRPDLADGKLGQEIKVGERVIQTPKP